MGTPPQTFPRDNTEEVPRGGVNPDDPPWGLPGALGLLLLSFVLMALMQAVLVVPYALRRGVAPTLRAVAEFASNDPGALFVAVASIIPSHLLTLGLAWLLVTRAGRHPFLRTLGWEWGAGLTFWRSVGLALLLYAAGFGVLALSGPCDNELERLLRSSRGAALAAAFAATFTAPLVEEVVFRGMLYPALRRLVGVGWAVAVVLFIFAAIHVPQYQPCYGVIATILLLSFVLTTIRARTGRLLPCFVVHLVFNAVQAVAIVLYPYLERIAPEQNTPAPGALVELLLRVLRAAW